MRPAPAARARSSSTATAASEPLAIRLPSAGLCYLQVTRRSAKPVASAENTITEHPLPGMSPKLPEAIGPAPAIVATPSATAAIFITTSVLQMAKLSPGFPTKRVPLGMQSVVGPRAADEIATDEGAGAD